MPEAWDTLQIYCREVGRKKTEAVPKSLSED